MDGDNEPRQSSTEEVLSLRRRVEFSHSICPECVRTLYPEFDDS